MRVLFPVKSKAPAVLPPPSAGENISFSLAPVERKDMDIVVDVSYLSYRSAYAYHDLNFKGISTGHVYGSLLALLTLHKEFSPSYNLRFVFALDGFPAWRKEQHPEYKAGRVKTLGYDPRNDVVSVFSCIPGMFLVNDSEEADDIIASYLTKTTQNRVCTLISSDKDLWVLKDLPNLRILGNKFIPVSDDDVEHSFYTKKSSFVSLVKSIIGDDLDNLPRVPRFPRKDLIKILHQMDEPNVECLFSVAKSLAETDKISTRSYSLLLEHEHQVRKTYSLASLRYGISYEETPCIPDKEKLTELLTAKGCTSLLPRLDSFFRRY